MVWLIGNNGMLGKEVELTLQNAGIKYFASDREVDITDYNILSGFVNDKEVNWIINCAAYTAVDAAEDDKENAYLINATGPSNIAKVAKEKGAKLIHISTDYVFDGTKSSGYIESDETSPTGVYGASKLEGEQNIINTFNEYFIIRISWLYGKHGNNFVSTILRLLGEKDTLTIVEDEIGSPTYAKDVADFIINIVESDSTDYSLYHFSNEGRISWYDFANQIYKSALDTKLINKKVEILPIKAESFARKAKRPKYSYMSKDKVKRVFGIMLRDWKDSLYEFISNMNSI